MINRILEWFKEDPEVVEPLDKKLATAVLLVEVSMADNSWDAVEEGQIRDLMTNKLKLGAEEQNEVIEAAKDLVTNSNDLYRFTNRINDTQTTEEKYELVVSLWQVAYADSRIDRYEDHMIRKISELLYLNHSHFIKAKHEAKASYKQ